MLRSLVANVLSIKMRLYLGGGICALAASTAMAQDVSVNAAPARQSVDGNGVDLFTGRFNITTPETSLGAGDGALKFYMEWNGATWSYSYAYSIIKNGDGSYTVSNGTSSNRFILNGSSFVNSEGDGGTLVFDGTNYIYSSSHGVMVYFDKAQSNLTNYEAISSKIRLPNNTQFITYWEYEYVGDNMRVYRFGGVKSEGNYLTTLIYRNYSYYDFNTPSINNFNVVDFISTSHIGQGKNGSSYVLVEYTDGYLKWTTADGKSTEYVMTGSKVTNVKRPGSISPDITIEYVGDRVSAVVTPIGRTTYSAIDNGGRRIVTVTNPASQSVVHEYDLGSQRLRTLRDATGRSTNWEYDGFGRVTRKVAPEGNQSVTRYDGRGNVVEQREISKTPGTPPDAVTLANYPQNCDNYVTCNLPTSTVDARGGVTEYSYDPTHGGVTVETSPAAANGIRPQTRYSYQPVVSPATNEPVFKLGTISTCRSGGPSSCIGAGDETRVSFAYDTTNMLVTSTSVVAGDGSLSATTNVDYDWVGNIVSIDGPLPGDSDLVRSTYNAARQVTSIISADPDGAGPRRSRASLRTYDVRGRLTRQEDGTANTDGSAFATAQEINTIYDAADLPLQQTLVAGGTTLQRSAMSYDAAGRVVCTVTRMDPGQWGGQTDACSAQTTGPNGPDRVTQQGYDAVGRATSVVTAAGTADASTESRTYTGNGQVASVTDGNGNVTSYGYDGFDRLSTTTYPGGSYEQLGYDAGGNVTSRRLRDGQSLYYTYDALNRLTYADNPNTSVAEVDASYSYDNLGRVLQAGDQNGWFAAFEYDALGRATRQYSNLSSNSMQYDAGGRMTRQTWGDGFFVTYEYDATGAVTAIRENGGFVLASYGYDDLGRRTSVSRGNGATTSYGYDGASRLASLGQDLAGGAQDLSLGFTYNPAGQIASRTSSNDAYAWTGAVNVDRGYSVNGLNQYTQAGGIGFGYDGRGNLTNSGGTGYGYNSRNEMTSGPGVQLAYRNPAGLLNHLIRANGTVTNFDYVGANLATEFENNQVARRYVHGPGADEPVVWYEGAGTGDRRWLHADERGSVVAVTNGGGAAVAINTYDEYGIPGAGNQGRFQYTGQKWMPELGLYDYKARMYSPTLGRFMQTDPIGYGDGMNWYNYVGGDPMNFIDPSGLQQVVYGPRKPKCGDVGVFCAYTGETPSSWDMDKDWLDLQVDNLPGPVKEAVNDIVVTARRQAAPTIKSLFKAHSVVSRSLGIVHDIFFPQACCFTAGTLVSTPSGLKSIETLKVGDLVVSRSDETGETAVKPIVGVTPAHERQIWTVTVSYKDEDGRWTDEQYETSDDHPWRTTDGQWIASAALKQGQTLARENGSGIVILVADTKRTRITYNLEIADFHTYFVGRAQTWVHNSCDHPSTSPVWKEFKAWRGKVKTDGRQYYAWDYTHNNIEVYNRRGVHIGVMDPISGQMIGDAVNGRTFDAK